MIVLSDSYYKKKTIEYEFLLEYTTLKNETKDFAEFQD